LLSSGALFQPCAIANFGLIAAAGDKGREGMEKGGKGGEERKVKATHL